MKRQRVIWVRSVSLLLAGLLLFLAGWGRTALANETAGKAAMHKAVTAPKTDKSQADAPAETQLSAAQFDAVVTPATSFDFGETIWLLPPPVMAVLLLLAAVTVLIRFSEPYFYFSYFRHVFGHFIAPNAP
ncbi:MAG: hypothetical protein EAZ91_07690 [Cytophagales bacterium]|nr:MAG: hypothetical protein EAZ91_07690 [Cytophagales bacterium]